LSWSIIDRLLADLAESRVNGGIVYIRGLGVEHATWAVLLVEGRVLGIVAKLRLLLGVEVVEVAVKLDDNDVGLLLALDGWGGTRLDGDRSRLTEWAGS
jgi:hypothetical protein